MALEISLPALSSVPVAHQRHAVSTPRSLRLPTSRACVLSQRSLVAHSRALGSQVQCSALSRPVVAAATATQEAFARDEAAKLERELPEVLEREAPGLGDSKKAARVCAEAMTGYFKEYNGELKPEAFADALAALEAEQVPAPFAKKVMHCLLGWARSNLKTDWRKAQ